jgi:hypothetical protein
MDNVQRYLQSGGTVKIIEPQGNHWPKRLPKERKIRPPLKIPIKTICIDCRLAKGKCIGLCLKAERYVSQDEIKERDHPFSCIPKCRPECIDETRNAFTWWPESGTILTVKKLYFRHKMRTTEIANLLYLSDRYVRKIVHRLKMKIRPKRLKSAHI